MSGYLIMIVNDPFFVKKHVTITNRIRQKNFEAIRKKPKSKKYLKKMLVHDRFQQKMPFLVGNRTIPLPTILVIAVAPLTSYSAPTK